MFKSEFCDCCGNSQFSAEKEIEFLKKGDTSNFIFTEKYIDVIKKYTPDEIIIKRIFCSNCGVLYHEDSIYIESYYKEII